MSAKEIRARYAEFITLLGAIKGNVYINRYSLEKCKMEGLAFGTLTQNLSRGLQTSDF